MAPSCLVSVDFRQILPPCCSVLMLNGHNICPANSQDFGTQGSDRPEGSLKCYKADISPQ